jgi:hypothetical protein
LPSGGERTTISAPSAPPAPPRFSITTSALMRGDSSCPTSRATMSTGPPAANGTTILTVSAQAGAANSVAAASAAEATRCMSCFSLDFGAHYTPERPASRAAAHCQSRLSGSDGLIRWKVAALSSPP